MRVILLVVDLCLGLLVSTAPAAPSVVINEVLVANLTSYPHGGGYPQWMELYNPGSTPAPLGGLVVSNPTRALFYRIPDSTPVLLPQRYRVIFLDALSLSNELHTGFTLNASGDQLALLTPAGAVLDSVSFGIQAPDFSIGRTPDGSTAGSWTLMVPTPGAANAPASLGTTGKLHINEWMAKASSGDDWLEVYNHDSFPTPLAGLVLSDQKTTPATNRPIPALSFIAPEACLQFYAVGAASPLGTRLDFKLSAKGSSIYLFDTDRTKVIDKVKFGTQTVGVSEGMLPDGSTNVYPFTPALTTPGLSNFRPTTSVYINELLTHTDPPIEDAVELFNPTSLPVDISYWLLSNQREIPARYTFPAGSIVQPRGFLVVYESQFKNSNPLYPNFTFNSAHGDQCLLTAADASGRLLGLQDAIRVGSAQHGIPFGRIATSTGVDYGAVQSITFGVDAPASVPDFEKGKGETNAPPLVGPLVISEVMYRPLDTGAGDPALDEYIELQNITGVPLNLFDPYTSTLVPTASPTNTYQLRGAVEYQFPPLLTLAAEARVLVVPFDPAGMPAQLTHFRQRFGIPPDVLILGPWKGSLSDAATIELYKPDTIQEPPHPDAGYLPSVLVDRVSYSDSSGWPESARGLGSALQRRRLEAYANDVLNWTAAAPTPGLPPAPSGLTAAPIAEGRVVVSFEALPGLSYSVQSRPTLPVPPGTLPAWQSLTPAFRPGVSTRTLSITNTLPPGTPAMFYRVVTPGI